MYYRTQLKELSSTKESKASAIVFKLFETAKANRMDPYDYIEFILDYLPQQDLVEDPERLDQFLYYGVKK